MSKPIKDAEIHFDHIAALIYLCKLESQGPRSLDIAMSPDTALALTAAQPNNPAIGLVAYADGLMVRTVHGIPVMVDWDMDGQGWYSKPLEKDDDYE